MSNYYHFSKRFTSAHMDSVTVACVGQSGSCYSLYFCKDFPLPNTPNFIDNDLPEIVSFLSSNKDTEINIEKHIAALDLEKEGAPITHNQAQTILLGN